MRATGSRRSWGKPYLSRFSLINPFSFLSLYFLWILCYVSGPPVCVCWGPHLSCGLSPNNSYPVCFPEAVRVCYKWLSCVIGCFDCHSSCSGIRSGNPLAWKSSVNQSWKLTLQMQQRLIFLSYLILIRCFFLYWVNQFDCSFINWLWLNKISVERDSPAQPLDVHLYNSKVNVT